MLTIQELISKYLKMFILGAIIIFIIDFIINGNLILNGQLPEYLVGDVLPLFFICSIGGVYEYAVMKRFKQKFNQTIYFLVSVFAILLCSVIFNYMMQSLPILTYKPYTHAGIIIYLFVVGVFYFFNKKEQVTTTEYGILNTNNVENKTSATVSPFVIRIIEVMLGISNGVITIVYLFAYSMIVSL